MNDYFVMLKFLIYSMSSIWGNMVFLDEMEV